MKTPRGFTLIELMIVVAIAAILTTIAVNVYTQYTIAARLPQAFNGLLALGQNLEAYYQDNNTYVGACQPGSNAPLPTAGDFTFSCPSLTTSGYTVQATGSAGTVVAGFTFMLNSQGEQTTVSVPTGWTNTGTCWVRDKAGNCS